MKAWVKGDQTIAAKVDPTIAALLAAVVDVLVRLNLHEKLGMSPQDMLVTLLDIAFLVLTARTIQINIKKSNRAANDSSDPPPADDPPVDNAA